jgi:hypothetical protein
VPTWLYAFACVAVPTVWAVVMFKAFGWWERRLAAKRTGDEQQHPHDVDYMI